MTEEQLKLLLEYIDTATAQMHSVDQYVEKRRIRTELLNTVNATTPIMKGQHNDERTTPSA
jgi:hypothetical protein